jgi:membrane protein DedA with SNARE-associated domain
VFLELSLAVLATLHGTAACVLLLLLVACAGIGAPWGQDVLLLAAAGLTSHGGLHPVPAMLAAWFGILAGDALSVWTGHYFGARWVRRPWAARFVPPQRLPALEERMRRHAGIFSFLTRLLPGQRASLFFIAGTLRMPYRPFFIGNGVAALLQVALFFYGARALGWQWQAFAPRFEQADDLLTLALLVVLLVWWWHARRGAGPRS